MSDSHSRDLLTDGSRWLTLRTELKLNCWRRVPLSLQRTSLFYLSFSFFSYPIVFMLAPLRTRETDRCPVETDAGVRALEREQHVGPVQLGRGRAAPSATLLTGPRRSQPSAER